MASESLVTNQTADVYVEEKKVADDMKKNGDESISQTKEIEGKDEGGKLEVKNSTNTETLITNSEEKTQAKESVTVVEVKKVEDSDKGFGSDVLGLDGLEEVKDPKQESDVLTSLEPAVEDNEKEIKNQGDVSDTHESSSEAEEKSTEDLMSSTVQEPESGVAKEPAISESVTEKVKSEELTEASAAPSSVSETEHKPEEPPIVSTVTEPASNVIETPVASAGIAQDEKTLVDIEANLESTKEEVTDLSKLDDETNKVQETVVSGSSEVVVVDAAYTNMLNDAGKGAVVPDVSDILEPESTYVDPNVNSGTEKSVGEKSGDNEMEKLMKEVAFDSVLPDPFTATSLTESLAKPQVQVEEDKQEKSTEVEDASLGETNKIDAAGEVAETSSDRTEASRGVEMIEGKIVESLVGNKTTVVMTSEDLDAATEILEVPPEGEMASEGVQISTEKNDESLDDDKTTLVEISSSEGAAAEVAEISSSEGAAAEISSSEGANISKGVETVKEKKNESLEGVKTTLIETSKELDPATEVAEVSSEVGKVSKSVERVEEEGENLEVDKTTSLKTSRDHNNATAIAEVSSSEGGNASKCVEMVKEENGKNLEAVKTTLIETSKDLHHATEVDEVSSEVEKASNSVERVEEEGENSEGDKTTLVETSKDLDATIEVREISSEGEKASGSDEMAKEKDANLEGDRGATLAETSKDPDAATEVSEVSSEVEKASGDAAMVKDKNENLEGDWGATLAETSKDRDAATEVAEISSEGEKAYGGAEMVEEKKGGSLEGDRTSVETSKELNVEEKNVIATPAKEPVGGPEEAESELKPGQDIQTITDKSGNEDSEVKKEESKKADDQNLIVSSKDGDTTDREAPKQVSVKPSERHSNNMISKVKKSIVKVRKAIFGKSPSSKTIASEGKDDIKVK